MADLDNNNDDEANDFGPHVSTLASCRPDTWMNARRRALVEQAVEQLQINSDCRRVLADWNDLRCSSLHSYRRIMRLYVAAILAESEADILKGLLANLLRLLQASSSPALVETAADELAAASNSAALAAVMEPLARGAVVPAAVAVGAALDPARPWLDLLLQQSVAEFYTLEQLRLARRLLASTENWSIVSPALSLKLKSHPDKALAMILGWIVGLPSPLIDDEWMSGLIKHLTGPKAENRVTAEAILVAWAGKNAASQAVIVTSLAATKATLAPARVSVYHTLERIATQSTEVDATVIAAALEGLVAMLGKEAKGDPRLCGQQALMEWLVVAKRKKETKGYETALEYLRAPVMEKKTADAGPLLGLLVDRVHPDVLEAVAADLWNAKWEKGLEALVVQATSKKAVHLEGLLAVYLTLLYADQKAAKVPAFCVDLFSSSSSFLYTMAEGSGVSSSLTNLVLPRSLALYTQLASKQSSLSQVFKGKVTAAARALAACATHPTSMEKPTKKKDQYASNALLSSLEVILTYVPSSADALVEALFEQVNKSALDFEQQKEDLNATRAARESEKTNLSIKGQGSANAAHSGSDAGAVRRVARVLVKHVRSKLAEVYVLMHVGSSLRAEGHQRAALILNMVRAIEIALSVVDDGVGLKSDLAKDIIRLSTSFNLESNGSDDAGGCRLSRAMHEAAGSLVVSLGCVASNFSPSTDDEGDEDLRAHVFARKMCIDEIAPGLSTRLDSVLEMVEKIPSKDVDLFLAPPGVLFDESDDKAVRNSVKIGGKHLTEEEEWELQMKKELAEKKKSAGADSSSWTLSAEDQKILAQQTKKREDMSALLVGDFARSLDSIHYLCSSDIEVGNACLPALQESVLVVAVSPCPAIARVAEISSKGLDTLTSLAACVFEIDEMHAPTIAQALVVSCAGNAAGQLSKNTKDRLRVVELPSPCAPAACVIYEMDQVHEALSGPSFAFLSPVIRASLIGPRTPPGCEAALRVLGRHTVMMGGEDRDPRVASLRRDMAVSVLELLKHDRSQTFQDPTPNDALVACYDIQDVLPSDGLAFSTSELAPLLDERGALGGPSCRQGSMLVLGHIAERHRKLVKSNPLIESRIWLNCFDQDDAVRLSARRAWSIVNAAPAVDLSQDLALPGPSPLYAAPLLPLLSHDNPSIAQAASDAFAQAMAKHPTSVSRNIETLCKTYIESYPSSVDGDDASAIDGKTEPAKTAQPTKTNIAAAFGSKKASPLTSGLPKKKVSTKKSALAVAGIGKPKVAKKKNPVASALLKPKEERTLDQAALESQFSVAVSIKKDEDKDTPSKVAVRLGVLRVFSSLAASVVDIDIEEPTLELLTGFLMTYGIAENNGDLKGAARNTLRDVVASKGGSDKAIAFLLPQIESVLKTGVADEKALGSLPTDKVPRSVAASDRRKEGAVVALGSVALHLKGAENEAKVDGTIDMLISTLSTPSEEVQLSVAEALSKLMKKGRTQDRIQEILSGLLDKCLNGDTLASQRGAAYGLSAAVKGSGIATLKKFEIVKQLEDACASGTSKSKEGSLFAIELLCGRLGLLFEPYVIALLPSLLKSFSDSNDHVRTAAANTVGLIMSKLSAHGVKLVMPAVLTAFNDPAWRTKQASIHMLGAMSHLAPKQLASALPKVVPKLTEAFSDTHTKVKTSAEEALVEISKVIRNPEISSISPVLLKALTDPADNTIKALEELIATEFLHAIDAPSLALIVPILHRGLRDRGATTKRFSGLITGNITTMINDPKDFVPYLPLLLPDLQGCLLDPIPDVRSTAAKALGSLTRSLGDQILPELRPWLVKKLRDEECSSAERSGAAQGLTEVLIASGSNYVDEAMRNEILPLRSFPEASTREGVLWMLTFLPPAMGHGFTPLIDVSLPALISGLSDDSEPVRDVAMRAGRVLIRSHGKIHVDKILPSLEHGLGDDDYRIRVASLSLLGDLLSMIGGTTLVKGDGETQDDVRRAERAQAQIALALGSETRKRVLSGLYLARSDSVHVVRSSALQVWKTVVSVTGRTLREILPVLVSKIIDDLASGDEEKTAVAGRCLGDVVTKLGDSVLPQIIPVLRNALYDGDEHTKRGVCVGLTEVIKCSTKDQILRFIEIIVKVVQDALSDDDGNVRRMAATSFQSLHSVVGNRAFDEVVPSLMVALEDRNADEHFRARALNGLTGILTVRSRELLPYIIPRLIKRPITEDHAKALSGIAEVTGGTLYFHFSTVIPALIGDLAEAEPLEADERIAAVRECARAICSSVDESGVNILISEIAAKCSSDKASIRRECCMALETVITERAEREDFYEQIPIMLRELLYRLNDDDESVLRATHNAFTALSKHVPAEELVKHVEFMRNLLSSMVSDARRRKGGVGDGEFLLPGFNMPRGLEPFIPIFQRGILYGNPTIREVSAAGLGELITLTSTKYLAGPLVVKMTGPLLRIVGDRNPANVKVAILKTLGLIMQKSGPALRAFVPQFQTTFVKALSDPSRLVRLEAIEALSLLMPLSTRVDPLIKELVGGSLGKNVNAEGLAASAIQTASLEALAVVLAKGGSKAKLPASIPSALDTGKELLKSHDDGIREAAAKVLGEACALLPPDVAIATIKEEILDMGDGDSSAARHGKACAIRRILVTKIGAELDSLIPELEKQSLGYLSDDKSQVREAGCVALGAVIGRSADPKAGFSRHEAPLLEILNNSRESMDVHRAMARGLCVALLMTDADKRIDLMGVTLIDACLQLALSGSQRVQFAYNDVLWLALDVANGSDGLDRYSNVAVFDNVRPMKSLHSKVLVKIKALSTI